VSKHWSTADGKVRAVDGISFALAEGTLNVLLGPSGCGKSTTLRLIAGPRVDGLRHHSHRRTRRHAAATCAAQHRDGVPELRPVPSPERRREHPLRPAVRRVAPAQREARLGRVADLLGLSPLLARKPSQLSGGQQQRVALGRAIINEAPVCLMDEPLSNSTRSVRAEMRQRSVLCNASSAFTRST
jgi:sn-glycerol 3-phosphate transport system ATP-binding protein